MNVRLPSGHIAPLEPPSLQRLLGCGGTVGGLCRAVWAEPDVDVEVMLCAARDDSLAIARWALESFADSDEAAELAGVCRYWGCLPSDRILMTDRVLAFKFDRSCMLAFDRWTTEHANDGVPLYNSDQGGEGA